MGLFCLNFLIFNFWGILPTNAATQKGVLNVIQNQENAQQWTGITKRLQAVGAKYCVIPLANINNVADLGQQRVLLLPNVETLTPGQAIALEEWMNRGGRLIASGPVGTLSTLGVRQALRNMLGGYWGFRLNDVQELQPAKSHAQEWATQKELFGKVLGAVMIPENSKTQIPAVWNSQDQAAAVLTTESSTFLGWRWGTDKDSTAELDTAWLKALVNNYLKLSTTQGISPSTNCPLSSATRTIQPTPIISNTNPTKPGTKPRRVTVSKKPNSPQPGTKPRRVTVSKKPNSPQPGTKPRRVTVSKKPNPNKPGTKPRRVTVQKTTPLPKPIAKVTPQNSQEEIDLLQEAVRLDVIPSSNVPIAHKDAISLQQELEHLIGRVESAHLAALARGANTSNSLSLKRESAKASTETANSSLEETLAQAKEVANNIPVLIAQKNYALARQQWLKTKRNLWQQFPMNQRLAQPEIRSVWLDRGTIVNAGNEAGLAQIFDRLSQAGINTVFFETVNASYTIYPSQVAPQQNPLIKEWDPLAAAVKLAHARGMELHAWVWTFAAGNRRHNQIIGVSPDYPGPVLAANPDWANYDQSGRMIPVGQTKPFLDPANPEVRQYLLKLYEEIVTRYQVDGIQLDYIRYPFQDPFSGRSYGYGKAAREQFKQQTGVDPVNISSHQRDLWQKWTAFRTEQVDSFVAEVSQMLRQKRSTLILSVAVFPLGEYERVQKIQQHWEVWARRGDIDLIVPMTYALDTPRFQRLAQPWISSTKLGSTLLVPGIRLLSLPTVGAFDQLQLLRDLPVSGYALFAAENFNNELDELLSSTQGKVQRSHTEPIPQRQPFRTAAFRFAALQQEWQFVGENNEQLSKSVTTMADFKSQSNNLQNALNQLAVLPSASNLISARGELTRFQTKFKTWMNVAAKENPYRVKVWENRLLTIERLLRYGERRVINKTENR
ncbi:family 10 glycosylhydrolase [Anabaena sphaerica FACHB-251]|uniref:Family 10 glycosylhydrolase n=2 Tax=Anabaena TaxID=1163 RepID=A0A926WCR8_9NOST|nr:family 10 glycosylhydrolase [Anabaena sphaerica]MBD2292179.1 family 10 glycosylhydrolase [Anabaena sphaerica FACHB-251]